MLLKKLYMINWCQRLMLLDVDTSGSVLKTEYNTDKSVLEKKINDAD